MSHLTSKQRAARYRRGRCPCGARRDPELRRQGAYAGLCALCAWTRWARANVVPLAPGACLMCELGRDCEQHPEAA